MTPSFEGVFLLSDKIRFFLPPLAPDLHGFLQQQTIRINCLLRLSSCRQGATFGRLFDKKVKLN